MRDLLTRRQRSEVMSRIRGSNTQPELAVRRGLHQLGYRFRLHRRDLPGTPDLVLPKYHAVIFVHGCFWHRHKDCPLAYEPKSRVAFWSDKFRRNVIRDKRQIGDLLECGWRVLIVWECALRRVADRPQTLKRISRWLLSQSSYAEVGAKYAGQDPGTPGRARSAS
jgi:DNA mismatch endonuclease, patch repair protein